MYFKNRADAGRQLAQRLLPYRTQHCVVLAINPGGVLVGAQIAIALHTDLFMLASEKIMLPGEPVPFGAVSSGDAFTYNTNLSSGEVDELRSEFYNVIETERITKTQKLHRILGSEGEIPRDMLYRRTIILVSDGLTDGFELEIATNFLKPIAVEKLIVVCPLANVSAVDSMHLRSDEIQCLYVAENLFDINHYYEDNNVPNVEDVHKIMKNTPLNWSLN